MRRRRALDRAAARVVGAGGVLTVASILAILLFITLEVLPLWRAPRVQSGASLNLARESSLLVPATDEYRQALYGPVASGSVDFYDPRGGDKFEGFPIDGLAGQEITAAYGVGDQVAVATRGGEAFVLRVQFAASADAPGGRRVPKVTAVGHWRIFDGAAVRDLAASRAGEAGITLIAAAPGAAPIVFAVSETTNVFGDVTRSESRHELPLRAGDGVSALAVGQGGKRAFVGTANGWVQYWDVSDKEAPKLVDSVQATPGHGVGVTALTVLVGDAALVVGDAAGNVSAWFPLRDELQQSGWRLQRVRSFDPHAAAVTAIAASPRNKGFVTADAAGRIAVRHSTTGRTPAWLDAGGGVRSLAFAPKGDGVTARLDDGGVRSWSIDNPHPEVSLGALFGKVWYEGYDAPAYVWQSTGGTDAVEPKLSLVPLIVGTLKGTFYALLFAVPIAVLGALYTSQFMHRGLRAVVKPLVEILAALPSVVLGFLAGLWLAPALEHVIPAVLAMLVVLPLLTFGVGVAWQVVPKALRGRMREGYELALLLVLLVAGAQACLGANEFLEATFFGGDFRAWMSQVAGLRVDQRNCLVVGFAMGFAVIPIIFTISEDALSNVPPRLSSGSLALGATRWQTATRVVLPTASAGIFSAVMVGFGRAIGETMIVLMATGNTPVLDLNLFTGMRTLSANIAVEISEAPQGGTLYRVLFLAALMLFVATFVANTLADVVRQRLRKRYQQL